MVGSGEGFFLCLDDEVAAANEGVLRPAGVILEFLIAPAVAADVEFPFCRVRTRAVGAVELIAPDQSPAGFRALKQRIVRSGFARAEVREQQSREHRYEHRSARKSPPATVHLTSPLWVSIQRRKTHKYGPRPSRCPIYLRIWLD